MNESRLLKTAATKPLLLRLPIYLRLSGPGWLQGAMTLGGGSLVTSLMIGAVASNSERHVISEPLLIPRKH